MSILGVGTDIVQMPRIDDIYKKFGDRFLHKNFHKLEIQEFERLQENKKKSFLAKRFAGKEAVSKAFGTGIGKNISFKDIAIVNNEFGAPVVKIFSKTLPEIAAFNIHISLSDDYPVALAFVIISV